jgi:formamidopyrimidine-DNA glycosylase
LPELPDVEVIRRYVEATALHQTIRDVELRAERILEQTTSRELNAGLRDRSFQSTGRHGRNLFVDLDNNDVLVLHFGMTGRLEYYKDATDEPEYSKMVIEFVNGYHLALVMPRKLGLVRLISDEEAFIREKELGPDVYAEEFEATAFKRLLEGRRGIIKSTLMNQNIMAGIGNVYADEILFQTRIHPKKQVSQLREQTLEELYVKTAYVLSTAIDRKANPDQFPASWIIPHREKGGECPRCGGEVRNITVSGRSAYFCPSCQTR